MIPSLSAAPVPNILEGVSNPLIYGITVFLFGGWILLAYMVRLIAIGKLCTGRELDEKNARISALEEALAVRDKQVNASLELLPEFANLLEKFHAARADRASDENN